MDRLDWTLLEAFAAVAEAGSLSAAARKTGISQPTLGRHIRRLEDRLGTPAFTRHRSGLALTDAGRALLPAAQDMDQAAARVALAAAGQTDRLAGTVRLTTSVAFAHFHMPPILAGLRVDAPQIQIELVPSDSSENLLFREADIALRMYRPTQLDVVTRHLGDVTLGIYAARNYLARIGLPDGPENFGQVEMIGYDRSELLLRGMREMGMDVRRDDFPLRCDDQAVYVHLVRVGSGAGIIQDSIAAQFPEPVRILPDIPLPRLPVWLTVPAALRDTPRVRFVWSRLERDITPLCKKG
ncbi:LysR family transcriptional regulator [Halovulum sp. GXIMD14794]